MNKYKKYILDRLSSDLSQMESNDDSDNYRTNTKNAEHIEGLFDFYLNEVKLSASDLANYLNNHQFLTNLLYSIYKDKYPQRENWRVLFQPALEENVTFFKDCFKECLRNHGLVINAPEGEEKEKLLEKNLKVFQDLIEIGKRSDHFGVLSQEDLSTSYSVYQNILQKENIFKSNFEFNDFKNSLKHNKPYFHSFVPQAIEYFKKYPAQVETITDKSLETFVSQIMTVKDPIYKEAQTDYLKLLIETSQPVRKLINSSYKIQMIENFQSLIPLYFEKLLPSETQGMLDYLGYQFPHVDIHDGSGLMSWISTALNPYKNGEINGKVFKEFSTIDAFTHKLESNFLNSKEIQGLTARVRVYLMANNIELAKTPEQEQQILEYINQNIHKFDVEFSSENAKTYKDVVPFSKIWNFLEKHNSPQLDVLKNNFENHCETIAGSLKSNNYYGKRLETIDHLLRHVNNDKIAHIISEKYDWSDNFNVQVDVKTTKGSKTKNIEMPLLFALLSKHNVLLFSNIIKEPILSKIADVKYKNQNIVQYLSTTPKAKEYLNILSEDSNAFKKLVIDNKKTLKALSEHSDDSIQKKTIFTKMDTVLEDKSTEVKKKKI